MTKKIITHNESETMELAAEIAAGFSGGEVLLLYGDLGAGKTAFTRGLGQYLNAKQVVNSPTFVIMKVYDVEKRGIKKLVHIDAYRLNGSEDLEALGVSEYFGHPECISVIEWPERLGENLPEGAMKIWFKSLGEEDAREIHLN